MCARACVCVRVCVCVFVLHVVANTDGVVRPLLRAMPALEVFCAIDSCLGHRETFEQCVPLSTVAPPASHSRRIAAPVTRFTQSRFPPGGKLSAARVPIDPVLL